MVVHASAPQLSSDSEVATAGYFQLSWSGEGSIFQLQEASDVTFQSFKVIYEGRDLARIISGKPDGDYFYRITTSDQAAGFSKTVKVTVAHHPLKNAILFFIAGAIVFISILVLIIKGSRQTES